MAKSTAKVIDKKVPCGFCGKEFNVPSAIKEGLIDENQICKGCHKKFADDPSNCFGKQDPKTGKTLSSDPNCKACEYLKACAAWPKNVVVFIEPAEEEDKGEENNMSTEKPTPPTAAAKGKGKGAKATTATKTPEPQASTKGKGTKAAATTKTKEPAEPKGEMIEYAPNCSFRKGTSIEIACSILTAKKSITLPDAVDKFKASGAESGNPDARVLRAFKYLKDAGVMTREVKGDVVTFTFTGKK